MPERTYLDWNATAPLRPEARDAMIRAMDVLGNPSSVHAEGRAARALVERARAQVAEALGAQASEVVFVSGATEAAALTMAGRDLATARVEHDAVAAWGDGRLAVDPSGRVEVPEPGRAALQLANGETGIVQDLPEGLAVSDLTQGLGKVPVAFDWLEIGMGLVSAHKIGGPKGVGAVVLRRGLELTAHIRGGGQEMGRRSGTENVIGIAGFGAAAEAATRELASGAQERVAQLRNILETDLERAGGPTIFVGKESHRLPNTSCLLTPGWKGETQVMALDMAGFAVSAGSACSSGKVRASAVLSAMGYGPGEADCAIRVSLGPTTTEGEVRRFAQTFLRLRERQLARLR
jgi:cysteine desulfurase